MFADIGGVPAVITKGGDDGHGWQMQGFWIFALVIVFLIIAFLKRDHHNEEQRNPYPYPYPPMPYAPMAMTGLIMEVVTKNRVTENPGIKFVTL